MEMVEVDGVDREVFARFHGLRDRVRRAEQEYPVGFGLEEARVLFAEQHSDVRVEGIAAVDGDAWLGIAWLDWPLQENTHLLEVELAVDPAYRRRGVGSRLLAAATERAKRAGRRALTGMVQADAATGASAGTAFARRHGFVRRHVELHQVIELPVPGAQLDELAARIAGQHDGYRLVQWAEHTPEEWLEQYADALSVMTEEVPVGDLDVEASRWTPARVREVEARQVSQGRYSHTTAAVAPDGTLAAYTQMGGTDATPERVYQRDTLVRPEHRGRRLGMAVKIPNLRALQAALDRPAVLHTWNAPDNAPMIAVNDRLGFRPVAQRGNWQLDL